MQKLILFLTIALTSCHVTKHTTTTKTETDQTTNIQASTSNTAVTTQTITETTHTLITIAADSTSLDFDNDTSLQSFDLPTELIIIHHNKLKVMTKIRVIPVNVDYKAVTTGTNIGKADIKEAVVSHSEEVVKDSEVHRTGGPNWTVIILCVIGVSIIAFWLFWWRNKDKRA